MQPCQKCIKTCLNSFPNNARGAYYRTEFNSDLYMHRSALLNQNFDYRSTKRYLPLNQRPQQNIDLPLNLKIIATLVPEPKTASTLPKCLKTCLNSFPNNARGAYYRAEFKSD